MDHLFLPNNKLYNLLLCIFYCVNKSLSVQTSCQTADLVFLLKFCDVRIQKKLIFYKMHPPCSTCPFQVLMSTYLSINVDMGIPLSSIF